MKKIIVILISLILLVGCTESNKNKTEYKVEDYVEIVDIETENTCETENCKESIKNIKLKDIKFNNLDESLTSLFLTKHKELIEVDGKPFILTDEEEEGFEYKNDFDVNIYKNILSIMETSEEFDGWSPRNSLLTQSLNIDLEKEKVLTNKELIELFDLNMEDVYATLLEGSVTHILDNYIIKLEKEYIEVEPVSIDEYKKNIPEYAKKLNNEHQFNPMVPKDEILTQDIPILSLYIKGDELRGYYKVGHLLSALGLGTLEGYDLNWVSQSVKISK